MKKREKWAYISILDNYFYLLCLKLEIIRKQSASSVTKYKLIYLVNCLKLCDITVQPVTSS